LQATLIGGDSIVFSPDGAQVATTSEDNTARIWDTDGTLQATLIGGDSIVFSPDGAQVANISTDGAVWILPVELEDLLDRGCQWLRPYLESHPDEGKDLSCPSTIKQ
ncbi:MAG: hypothetical protein QNJ46_33370, partial [Leptolyngbyaceae cyanobacterium MO_188.B28]|nr:hypothetical protein [Leptolyngbyaceae cyanobacterium MO_188.B28]